MQVSFNTNQLHPSQLPTQTAEKPSDSEDLKVITALAAQLGKTYLGNQGTQKESQFKMTSATALAGLTKPTEHVASTAVNTATAPASTSLIATSGESNTKIASEQLKDVTREMITINSEQHNVYVSKTGNFRQLYGYKCLLMNGLEDKLLDPVRKRREKGDSTYAFISMQTLLEVLSMITQSRVNQLPTKRDQFLLKTVSNAIKSFFESAKDLEKADQKPGIFLRHNPAEDWMKFCNTTLNHLLKTWKIQEIGKVELFLDDLAALKFTSMPLGAQDPRYFNCLEWALLRSNELYIKKHLCSLVSDKENGELLVNIVSNVKKWNYSAVQFEDLRPKDLVIYLSTDNKSVHAAIYVGKDKDGNSIFESKFGFRNTCFHHHRLFDVPLTEYNLIVKALFFRKPSETAAAE